MESVLVNLEEIAGDLYNRGVLKNFAKFTGKHKSQSCFVNKIDKVAGWRPALLLKKKL